MTAARRSAASLGVRALGTFAEVIRTGSATVAGRNLGMTQPAVSRIIAQLEANVGFELFYRDRGRLIATKDGLALAEEVELALAGLRRVDSLVSDIATSAVGELRVVAPPSFAEGLLPEIVAAFLERFPGVRFSLDSRTTETAKAMIATRVVDCGFMKLPVDDSDLRCEPLMANGSVCVLAADHPLARHATLTPELLADQPLILLGSGRQWRVQVDAAFAAYRLRPRVGIETHTHGSACALAARGVGIAIVNERLARSYLRDPLVARPFTPPIMHEYAFVTSALSQPSRLAREFHDQARALLAGQD
ncbi:LysR family transcriptional regulator [Sphingomonas colocasiae]|uniref:LysR family transcriptional regulator n=1 Tax=Sphingomonas colocasiae TaxID=1848973 RepID=A0ABS7PK00_9SPHN|nr:LysR family transcriptional regulator [Sphingomonas colocasiae]MBY8821619.1 LysR family transcriptional regulator [Sphingomonas colocasiae]